MENNIAIRYACLTVRVLNT